MTFVFNCARAALIVAALMGASAVRAADMPVSIDNFVFTPAETQVSVGTTVIWTNNDDIPHTVVDADHKYKSSALDTGDKFSHTFTEPGTYEYFCSLHPHMTGKIIVK
ncbi:MAG: cupredoxin family copper-binding protein [Hyphomicrobiales bacterium]|nr:cupredoxin family copper-binding protein [Hyphomicrobiales bacterium]MBV8768608.1 cupredoxin family copper-binding protein [Hyphomicrobiales bacterium]MBV9054774.1 cupredoxin family copper-binding protein [Hyphomicrobiales bacterium]MBV9138785.1 cupredoxin family copper-binding protein [Hyphomicrobiales bacterium]MBV9590234.1 cupredoxin family copper-binding protein [Hyphomicrobiales bacterium]